MQAKSHTICQCSPAGRFSPAPPRHRIALAGPGNSAAHAQQPPAIDAARLRSAARATEHLWTAGRAAPSRPASAASPIQRPISRRARGCSARSRAAGLTPRIDPAGNVFVRWPADQRTKRPADPVRVAHRFGAVRRQLRWRPRHARGARGAFRRARPPASRRGIRFEMVLWAHEESTAFGHGTAASRIVAGDLQAGDLDQVWNGCAAPTASAGSAAIPRASKRPCGIPARGTPTSSCTSSRAARSTSAASTIGVVEGIVSIHRYDVTITGFANHAGTTPMGERQDALLAASRLTLAVREAVTARPDVRSARLDGWRSHRIPRT